MQSIVRLFERAVSFVVRGYSMLGNRKTCNVCGARFGSFLPYKGGWKNVPELMLALDVIGSDVGNFSCPYCYAHDRERHLIMYFDALSIWTKVKDGCVLHFAPERAMIPRIQQSGPAKYIRADLFPASNDMVREDITKLSFPDKSFDLLIANHILEHVADADAALAEIFRVLKTDGIAILQTPYSSKLRANFSDEGIDDDKTRRQVYGQEDHVRLFGRCIFEQIQRAGFTSMVCTHEQVLREFDPSIYGVNPQEPFFCFRKVAE